MKWLVVALLVINVAFAGWRAQVGDAAPSHPAPPVSASAHVNRLLLLSEIDAEELRPRGQANRASNPRAAGEPVLSPEPGVCLSIGPVAEGDEIERMRVWLVERGANTRLRTDERRELALYWVFFEPLASRAAARERVSELKGKGVEDIFMIGRGDMANAVSLGVYSRKASLERRLAELRGHGYEPEVLPRYRQKKATWYDVRFPVEFEFPTDKFTLAFPGAQASSAACESIQSASEGENRTASATTARAPTGAQPDTGEPKAADAGSPAPASPRTSTTSASSAPPTVQRQ